MAVFPGQPETDLCLKEGVGKRDSVLVLNKNSMSTDLGIRLLKMDSFIFVLTRQRTKYNNWKAKEHPAKY